MAVNDVLQVLSFCSSLGGTELLTSQGNLSCWCLLPAAYTEPVLVYGISGSANSVSDGDNRS